MSWRQAVTLVIIIFVLTVVQALLAGPLTTLETDLVDSGDYSNEHFDGDQLISGMFEGWWNMGLAAVFLLIGAAFVRAVQDQLAARRRGGS